MRKRSCRRKYGEKASPLMPYYEKKAAFGDSKGHRVVVGVVILRVTSQNGKPLVSLRSKTRPVLPTYQKFE